MSHLLNIEPGLHEDVERTLGTGDLRLVYGLGVPALTALALIVAAIVADQLWLGALALLAVLLLCWGVVQEFGHMLDETGDDD